MSVGTGAVLGGMGYLMSVRRDVQSFAIIGPESRYLFRHLSDNFANLFQYRTSFSKHYAFKAQNMQKMYDIGQNIGQIIGQVAIKGCLKLFISATIMSFKHNRCYPQRLLWQG